MGAEGYLAKPFDIIELLDEVVRLRPDTAWPQPGLS